MFAYLKGVLAAVEAVAVVLDVQGVGYRLCIPSHLKERLPPLGSSMQWYTTLIIREEAHTLYGFLEEGERQLFEILMNIAGVGPKLALNLVGHLPLHDMQQAVEHRELAALCRVPGVGKKTAERLMIELKDRLPALAALSPGPASTERGLHRQNQAIQDAVLALVNLGYHQQVAHKAVRQSLNELPPPENLAELITAALKQLAPSR